VRREFNVALEAISVDGDITDLIRFRNWAAGFWIAKIVD
jgi:hypothetical protein